MAVTHTIPTKAFRIYVTCFHCLLRIIVVMYSVLQNYKEHFASIFKCSNATNMKTC